MKICAVRTIPFSERDMLQKLSSERAAPRTRTKITGTVTCNKLSSIGTVTDLSANGICFQLVLDINAKTGQHVTIESEELGYLTGMVQWYRGNRIGIKLKLSSNTAAQIASFYKFFH